MQYQRSPLRGRSFYLKLVKKEHNSKTITFIELRPLSCMMSKYSKFGVDTFNTFWATLKFLHNDNNDDLAIITAWLFLWNRQANIILLKKISFMKKKAHNFFFVFRLYFCSNIKISKKSSNNLMRKVKHSLFVFISFLSSEEN